MLENPKMETLEKRQMVEKMSSSSSGESGSLEAPRDQGMEVGQGQGV